MRQLEIKSVRIIVFMFLILSELSIAQPAGFAFGKQIEISSSSVSGAVNLIDFPVYLDITDLNLRSTTNGGHIQSANGFDILFTSSDCSTALLFQIEEYNPVTGQLIVWVRVPILSATNNTQFFLYYGNSAIAADPSSTSTWNSDFEGVWHMNNDPSSSLLNDYTGNGINGTSFGAMTATDLIPGKLGNGINFDGSNDYFALASKFYTNQGEIAQISISAWVNTTYSSNGAFNNWSILDFDRSEYFNIFVHGNGQLGFATRAGGISDSYGGTPGDLNDGNWHYVVGVFNGTNKLLYIDGALSLTVANPHGGVSLGTGTNRFGFIGEGSEASTFNANRNNIYYNGSYDEIRFLNTSLSSDWISTEYNNQNSPSTFYSHSAELSAEDLCLTLPVEFGTFDAILTSDRVVDLNWNTVFETNNDYFEVLKSKNAFDWEILDIVDGAGNSTEQIHYQSTDKAPNTGINYYKIKQIDLDGNFEYSSIRTASLLGASEVTISPNPVSDLLTIRGFEHLSHKEIQFRNKLGISVKDKINIIHLSDKIQLDLTQLSAGIYFLQTSTETIRIIKL